MEPTDLNAAYWESRYRQGQTGWDVGYVSTPLRAYFDQLTDRSLQILIPGGGNSYEGSYLWEQGFRHLHLLDYAEPPLAAFRIRHPNFPAGQLHQQNFFDHTGQYDLIVEQTFFSALHPSLRPAYVAQMHDLLRPGGRLVGLLFDAPLYTDHPPYGGSLADYLPLFEPPFTVRYFERAHNSIGPRQGRELFVLLEKPTA